MSGPYALVLRFRARGTVQLSTPEVVHAAFLSLVRSGDPALGRLLHAPDLGRRPFSLAVLGPRSGPELRLRVGILAPDLFARFWERWERQGGIPLRLGRERLAPLEVATQGPWAGRSTWSELVRLEPAKTVNLVFCTPTTFRQGDVDLPLPVPRLVFGSLLAQWNAFSPLPLAVDGGALEAKVALSEARIRTCTFHDGRSRIPGFVGRVEFRVLRGASPEMTQAVRALTQFALYAGVGRKTTHGMGLVREAQ